MKLTEPLEPCQIVYLEAHGDRLYAEVIQVVPSRGLAWVRPLVLVPSAPENQLLSTLASEYYDLRQGADLLWPLESFHPALDVEAIPILSRLGGIHPGDDREPHQQLRQFISCLWRLDRAGKTP